MKRNIFFLVGIFIALLEPMYVFAQKTFDKNGQAVDVDQISTLRITWPLNRAVFQRGASDNAVVPFTFQWETSALPFIFSNFTPYYRIIALDLTTGNPISSTLPSYQLVNSSDIQTVNNLRLVYIPNTSNPTNKGWYRLDVLIKANFSIGPLSFTQAPIAVQSIKFGVGDVYTIAGQSNASGYPKNVDTDLIQNTTFTERDAVSVRTSSAELTPNQNPSGQSVKIAGLPFTEGFSKLTQTLGNEESRIYPKGDGSWSWGPLGDKLLTNSNTNHRVPVLFFNAALPQSDIKQWSDKTWKNDANVEIPNPYSSSCSTPPCLRDDHWVYEQARSVLQTYNTTLGIRQVFWHQGENDAIRNKFSPPISDFTYYTGRMETVINQSRSDIGNNNLQWSVSKVSYHTYPTNSSPGYGDYNVFTYPALTTAQNNVSNKRPGIETDNISVAGRGPNLKIHFSGSTHAEVANRWFNSSPWQATPVQANSLLKLNASIVNVNGTNYWRLTVANPPSGAYYFWSQNENGVYQNLGTQSYVDLDLNSSFLRITTCYVGTSTGSAVGTGDAHGYNLKFQVTQPFISPGTGYINNNRELNANPNMTLSFGSGTSSTSNAFTVQSTNVVWGASSSDSWVNVEDAEGNKTGGSGSTVMKVNITSANPNSTSRSATITILSTDSSVPNRTLTITQAGSGGSTCSTTYLSSLTPDAQFQSCCGNVRNNQTIDGLTMNIGRLPGQTTGGTSFPNGVGTHASSRLEYAVPSGSSIFKSFVGRDDEADNCNCGTDNLNITFRVKVKSCSSCTETDPSGGAISVTRGPSDPAQEVTADVSSKSHIVLYVDQIGEYWGDHADWASARFECGGSCSNPPNPSVSPTSVTISSGQSTSLTANCSSGTVRWSTGAITNSISVSPTTTTQYWAKCESGSCSSGQVYSTVTVNGTSSCIDTKIISSHVFSATQDYGTLMYDKTVDNNTMNIGRLYTQTTGGTAYTTGLGTHSNSRIECIIPSGSYFFRASVGRDDETDNCGCGTDNSNVIFRIKVKDCASCSEIDPSSGAVSVTRGRDDAAQDISVNITGKARLVLYVDKVGENWGDHVDWAKARFVSGCPSGARTSVTNQNSENNNILEAEQKDSFIVYPNPADKEVNVKFNLTETNDVSFDLIDLQGKVLNQFIFQQRVGTHNFSISLDKYQEGSYILRGTFGNRLETKKITIQR